VAQGVDPEFNPPYHKKKKKKKITGFEKLTPPQVGKSLLNKRESLNSNHSTTGRKKNLKLGS
jgi:hypothetical protein